MNKAAGVAIAMAAAIGTAAVMVSANMKPSAKRALKNEFRDTFHHMDNVKDNLCNVRQDMTHMARTLKDQM